MQERSDELKAMEAIGKKLFRVGIVHQSVTMRQVWASDAEEAKSLIEGGHGVPVGHEGPVPLGVISMEVGKGQYKQGMFLTAFNQMMAQAMGRAQKEEDKKAEPLIVVPSMVPPKDIVPAR